MNPFIESTVARPLTQAAPSRPAGAAIAGGKKKRRSLMGLAIGAMGLATSLGIAPPAGLQAAGALLARAGLAASMIAPSMAYAIDINSATLEQLEGVRGIGPKTAQIIIEERTRGGRYESFEDVSDRVKGIGPKKAAGLQAAGLTLAGPGAGSSPGRQDAEHAGKASSPAKAGALPRGVKKSQ